MLFIALHGFLFGMPRFRQPLLAIMLAIIILASMQKPKGMQVKAGALLVGLLLVGYLIELRLFWF
jgi:hypothetical protein